MDTVDTVDTVDTMETKVDVDTPREAGQDLARVVFVTTCRVGCYLSRPNTMEMMIQKYKYKYKC